MNEPLSRPERSKKSLAVAATRPPVSTPALQSVAVGTLAGLWFAALSLGLAQEARGLGNENSPAVLLLPETPTPREDSLSRATKPVPIHSPRPDRAAFSAAGGGSESALGRAQVNSFTSGQLRLQALTPTLLRMEFSPSGQFVDAPSVAVINRQRWPRVALTTKETNGWLTASTGPITLSYKLNSGPFNAQNLQVSWRDGVGRHEWKPGDPDGQNLGGVPASLDNRSTKAVTEPGPLSRKGCFLLDDSKSALFVRADNWVKARTPKDSLDWYFLAYGTDYKSALKQLSDLLGPIPLLPRYVFGTWFGSRAGYSDQQWQMIVQQFRDEHLPLDLVVLDSDSKSKMVWSGYDWDLEQIPDPAGFFAWMARQGVKVTVNEHYQALTRQSDSRFETIRQALGLPADVKEIPHAIGDKKYAALFMDLLHQPDLDRGLAFWWQDGAAPAGVEGLDDLLWTRHVEYQGSERITGRRTTAFCRLGNQWGSHRYGIFFTGDLHGVWPSLPVLIPATVRGGNQLVPYMNNLCGGVFVVDLPPELYSRWVQFSSLSPLFWFHGLWGLRLPWEYGPDNVANYRNFVGLRYTLLPYIYTCSRVAHETGLPLVRGTYLEYPDQEAAYTFDQQYLFGDQLLVAPITAPGNGKPARKQVFLPAGDDWFDFFTGDFYRGGRTILHECPLDRMPLFARAGSILPRAPLMDFSDQKPVDPLTLEVYAGARPAAFNLYEDDGLSLAYRAGAYAWTPFHFRPAPAGNYTLSLGAAQGSFKGQLAKRRYLVRLHGLCQPQAVALNGRRLTEVDPEQGLDGWWWDGRARTIMVRLNKPLAAGQENVLSFSNAGTSADLAAWQRASNLRAQLRQLKRDVKLKHAALVSGPGIKKPPRAMREIEAVERLLTDVVDHPKGRGSNPPDYPALESRIVAALANDPFESNRALPELDPESLAGMDLCKGAKFTSQEMNTMTNRLRGADSPAWLWPGP